MYTLCLQKSFESRHFLFGGDWGAENHPHSHPYRVEIRLCGPKLDAHGYLVDLDRLDAVLEACLSVYRGNLLNDIEEFEGENPSIERFAERFYARFVEALGPHGFHRIEVRMWENDMAWAAFREGDA